MMMIDGVIGRARLYGSELFARITGGIGYYRKSYSQEGEDIVLDRVFDGVRQGFYVDVGAHHPRRFSNTYLMYMKGWRGINIDATPGSMKPFLLARPRDINIEVAVASSEKNLSFYVFEEPALNTFDRDTSLEHQSHGYRVAREIVIRTRRLDSILKEHVPNDIKIDFMSVDVEGYDMQVLESNDWSVYRPLCVMVEVMEFDMLKIQSHPVYRFMTQMGYVLYAKTGYTLLFRDGVV